MPNDIDQENDDTLKLEARGAAISVLHRNPTATAEQLQDLVEKELKVWGFLAIQHGRELLKDPDAFAASLAKV